MTIKKIFGSLFNEKEQKGGVSAFFNINRKDNYMCKRKNSGYIITDSIHIGNTEFVIGHNPKAPSQYVTWACAREDYYFWGHYMSTRLAAEKDLLDRASKEYDIQLQLIGRTMISEHKEQER